MWTQRLSLKKTSMEARQKITYEFYSGLSKDKKFNSRVESGEMQVANVLTYLGALGTAILSKAMHELQNSAREVKEDSMLV